MRFKVPTHLQGMRGIPAIQPENYHHIFQEERVYPKGSGRFSSRNHTISDTTFSAPVAELVDTTRLSKYGFMMALELRAPQKATRLILRICRSYL